VDTDGFRVLRDRRLVDSLFGLFGRCHLRSSSFALSPSSSAASSAGSNANRPPSRVHRSRVQQLRTAIAGETQMHHRCGKAMRQPVARRTLRPWDAANCRPDGADGAVGHVDGAAARILIRPVATRCHDDESETTDLRSPWLRSTRSWRLYAGVGRCRASSSRRPSRRVAAAVRVRTPSLA
jgi:hypothetical protein